MSNCRTFIRGTLSNSTEFLINWHRFKYWNHLKSSKVRSSNYSAQLPSFTFYNPFVSIFDSKCSCLCLFVDGLETLLANEGERVSQSCHSHFHPKGHPSTSSAGATLCVRTSTQKQSANAVAAMLMLPNFIMSFQWFHFHSMSR